MIERCHFCGKVHEILTFLYGGVPYSACAEVPEGYMVPLRKVPVVIHGPQGEVFESFRYELVTRDDGNNR